MTPHHPSSAACRTIKLLLFEHCGGRACWDVCECKGRLSVQRGRSFVHDWSKDRKLEVLWSSEFVDFALHSAKDVSKTHPLADQDNLMNYTTGAARLHAQHLRHSCSSFECLSNFRFMFFILKPTFVTSSQYSWYRRPSEAILTFDCDGLTHTAMLVTVTRVARSSTRSNEISYWSASLVLMIPAHHPSLTSCFPHPKLLQYISLTIKILDQLELVAS
jgi:hypothetical protein